MLFKVMVVGMALGKGSGVSSPQIFLKIDGQLWGGGQPQLKIFVFIQKQSYLFLLFLFLSCKMFTQLKKNVAVYIQQLYQKVYFSKSLYFQKSITQISLRHKSIFSFHFKKQYRCKINQNIHPAFKTRRDNMYQTLKCFKLVISKYFLCLYHSI